MKQFGKSLKLGLLGAVSSALSALSLNSPRLAKLAGFDSTPAKTAPVARVKYRATHGAFGRLVHIEKAASRRAAGVLRRHQGVLCVNDARRRSKAPQVDVSVIGRLRDRAGRYYLKLSNGMIVGRHNFA